MALIQFLQQRVAEVVRPWLHHLPDAPSSTLHVPENRPMETITITGNEVQAVSPEGQKAALPLDAFLKKLSPVQFEMSNCVMPDGFKASLTQGNMTVWVSQLTPRVYQLKWIDPASPRPYGSGSTYRLVKVAVPYLVILTVFVADQQGRINLTGKNECFFRKAPLDSLDDELFYPALLNCSKYRTEAANPLSWICTQHLPFATVAQIPDTNKRMRAGHRALLTCLLDTGFNYSSEHHEGSSWYTESRKIDQRINDIDKWQAASEKDPLFVLEVPWLKTGRTVRAVVERIFKNHNAHKTTAASSSDLARIVFNGHK